MSLLDEFIAAGQDTTTAWVDDAVKLGRGELDSLPDEVRPSAQAMLTKLFEHREDIAALGKDTFGLMLMRLKYGQVDEARLVYLATVATPDERDAALRDATNAAEKEHNASDAAWSRAKDLGLKVLEAGGEAALPFLFTILRAL